MISRMNMELVTNIPETVFSGQFTHHTSSDDGDGVSEMLDTNPCTWVITQMTYRNVSIKSHTFSMALSCSIMW